MRTSTALQGRDANVRMQVVVEQPAGQRNLIDRLTGLLEIQGDSLSAVADRLNMLETSVRQGSEKESLL